MALIARLLYFFYGPSNHIFEPGDKVKVAVSLCYNNIYAIFLQYRLPQICNFFNCVINSMLSIYVSPKLLYLYSILYPGAILNNSTASNFFCPIVWNAHVNCRWNRWAVNLSSSLYEVIMWCICMAVAPMNLGSIPNGIRKCKHMCWGINIYAVGFEK